MRKFLLLNTLIALFVLLSVGIIQSADGENPPRTKLRSSYMNLSLSQVQSMSNISIRKKDKWGLYGHSTIIHRYEKKFINGDGVVIDHATGLMWHQSGSSDYMRWENAKNWIGNLNYRKYAGYQDWRLPTLEEAVSLLEPGRSNNNLYIGPVFNDEQWGIWSIATYMVRKECGASTSALVMYAGTSRTAMSVQSAHSNEFPSQTPTPLINKQGLTTMLGGQAPPKSSLGKF